MGHDTSKVLLGSTGDSDRVITPEASDPADFPAGRAVRKSSTGALTLLASAGPLPIGVSLGASLSDTAKTAVARVGDEVPIQLAVYLVKAQLTFISKVLAPVAIELVTGGTAGDEEVTVTGDDEEGYLISVSMDSTVSTTTQIKAALDGEADSLALIETQIASGQGATAVTAFAEDDIDSQAQAVIGAAVRVSDFSGMAIPTGGTLTGAMYVSGSKDGIAHADGSIAYKVALIDMGGGL